MRSKPIVKRLERTEKPSHFVVPWQRRGVVPCVFAIGQDKRPIKQVAHMCQYLDWSARGRRRLKGGKHCWCTAKRLCGAVGESGYSVAEKIGSHTIGK